MPEQSDLIRLLGQMPVFGGLNDDALLFILNSAQLKHFVIDEFIFMEGESANSLFVIQQGTVVVEKKWQEKPISLGEFGAGDCLGEMAIIDLQARSASVRAVTSCQALEISRLTLHELYKQDLEQFAIIMMNMGREVSRRLRQASERLFELDQSMPT